MSLELLIDHPTITADQIIAVAEDCNEILDAAHQVLVRFEEAHEHSARAVADNEAALERSKAAVGTDDFIERYFEQIQTEQRAEDAIRAAQEAWERYRPWKEASERLEAALRLVEIQESN
ncbi:MAG TPA: hypothetical protein VMG10_12735 [Gemmataceae bacterium]|nr:hypothetical protein [Gemmataceae bacterium]